MLRSRYYYLLCGVILLTVTACASSPRNPPSEPASSATQLPKYAADFVDEYSRTKLRKNADYILCDQPGYLACFKVTHEQCLREVSATKDPCFKKTERQFPNPLTTAKEINEFTEYLIGCMVLKHALISMARGANETEIGACIKHMKVDLTQRDKSLKR